MSCAKLRGLLMTAIAGGTLLLAPSESQACRCLDWLCPWNWGRGSMASTTYAPPYAPSYSTASYTAAAPRTCCYVPQTCYRTVYRSVPMTTCQPVVSRDPCTGCPVTCYRPMTTTVRRACLVPYTTYRLVWSNPCATTVSACAPVATSVSPCSACGPATSTTVPYYRPSTSSPATTGSPADLAPTLPGSSSGNPTEPVTPQRTFRQKPVPEPETEMKLNPIPDTETKSIRAPRLIDPDSRSAAAPIRQAMFYRSVSRPSQPATTQASSGGWRASRD